MNRVLVHKFSLLFGAMVASGLAQGSDVADYACDVTVKSGQPAFVLVETDSRDTARQVAARVKARPANGVESPVVEVHECIDRRQERFRDREVQQRFEQLPL